MELLVVFWLICAGIGAAIAAKKDAAAGGGVAGCLLGPLGIVLACFLDNRPQCPHCTGRLDRGPHGMPRVCRYCGRELQWLDGEIPATPEQAGQWRASQSEKTIRRTTNSESSADFVDEIGKGCRVMLRWMWSGLSFLRSIPPRTDVALRRILGDDNLLIVRFLEFLILVALCGAAFATAMAFQK